MSTYLNLPDSEITKLTQQAIEFVTKDVENAFPLILKKSFSLLDIPKILGIVDKEENIEQLQEADAFLDDLEAQITDEVLKSVEAILTNFKL